MKYFFQSNNNNSAYISPKYEKVEGFATALTKIKIDQIKTADQIIATEFICRLCNSIPIDPAKCPKCNSIFCRNEYTSYVQVNLKCPNSCEYYSEMYKQTYVTILTQTENNILGKIGLMCQCKLEGLTYSNIESHYLTCKDRAQYSCLACKSIKDYLEDIEEHVNEKCPILFTTCETCNAKIRNSETENHEIECKLKCHYCNNVVARLKVNDHKLNECHNEIRKYYENLLREEGLKEEQMVKYYTEQNFILRKENKKIHYFIHKARQNFIPLKNSISAINSVVNCNAQALQEQFDFISRKPKQTTPGTINKCLTMCKGLFYVVLTVAVLILSYEYYFYSNLGKDECSFKSLKYLNE
jgi:hypothetical protein